MTELWHGLAAIIEILLKQQGEGCLMSCSVCLLLRGGFLSRVYIAVLGLPVMVLVAAVDASLAPQHTLLQVDSRLQDSLARFRAEMASSKADSGPRAFVRRCLNIMDPLLPTNNLGRSVVRSSFARIRRAFGHGAVLLRCLVDKVRHAAASNAQTATAALAAIAVAATVAQTV